MQFMVAPIKPQTAIETSRGEFQLQRADHVKMFSNDVTIATRIAEKRATATPGVQYGVFGIVNIIEALPPAKAKLVHKVVNDAGEIVPVTP